MFLGRFEHTIDEKGRITVPARFRELLADGAYVTQGFDHNLIVLPAPSFEQMYANVNQMSMTDPVARQLKRFIFANAVQVDFDRAGRMLLPQYLRESVSLDGNAILAYTEQVSDPDSFQTYLQNWLSGGDAWADTR